MIRSVSGNTHVVLRVALFAAALASSVLGPWWLALGIASLLIVAMRAYEAVFAGLMVDILYAPGFAGGVYGEYLCTAVLVMLAVASCLARAYLKRR